ncbi:LexA family protein [Pseudomonas aeruginosa]|uniref:LexA family protein n=1 Tax=Pseudomonas aeruginosa TaxID=287 RepID=UPI002076B238|nr:translesion error-prone DNA polymerase V autoproteolytic subunit [Pseudomonas aeruginosa]MCM8593520.1 translesion error-prone DNA polymerase V autoproteolytic subunit [Pseudomonas aeruginosa]MCM8677431.1 translesion error-prone DNA polymerase V autoproteolytic subunit [Pseudomonas aeruginosa]MCP2657378.1 translesion error-prone DNA polymerase V autoproteolytic subunit [Pseudomonas aeruginosa]WBH36450.1 Protein UmuD [Pseudomonas aeruginosa]HCR1733632.1 translesion error-prone DNA polymerase 
MPVTILGPVAGSGASLRLYSSKVSAGFPSPAQDHLEREISLDEILQIRAPHTYLVRAGGDSMIRAGIHDGDLMVVDRSREAEPEDIVIAAVNGEPTVKRLAKDGHQVVLRAENPRYAPRYILEGDELLVWGVVRYSVRCHEHG